MITKSEKFSFFLPLLLTTAILGGCASTPQEEAYRDNCVKTTPRLSKERWDCLRSRSSANIDKDSTRAQKSGKAADALLMGIICASTPNPSACMSGAADSLSGRSSESSDERLRRVEKKARDLEEREKRQCIFKGGFYNSATGCSR